MITTGQHLSGEFFASVDLVSVSPALSVYGMGRDEETALQELRIRLLNIAVEAEELSGTITTEEFAS